jgi:hypothetical protein
VIGDGGADGEGFGLEEPLGADGTTEPNLPPGSDGSGGASDEQEPPLDELPSNGTGGAPAAPENTGGSGSPPPSAVDCSGIAQNPAYELCASSADRCAGVFTNGAGCAAFCAAAGLTCVARYGGEPGCQQESTPLECAANTGNLSDWCECGPSTTPPPGNPSCPTDPQRPATQRQQHYSQATFAPRSSWVLQCRDYAYTAQYAEHAACDSQYSPGSGKGKATFLFNVNPGTYDVYVEGRHTANRNPAGARVEVIGNGDTHVAYISQRSEPHVLTMDLHGRYCLDGPVQVVIDSSVSSASDSVSQVRLVPVNN